MYVIRCFEDGLLGFFPARLHGLLLLSVRDEDGGDIGAWYL